MKTNDLKETKAITLIALIVTIVVLLILAGVSIAVLTGENGILNRATEAKATNEQKTAEEELKLGIVALSTDYYSKTTRPSTFREFIFNEASKTKLNQELNGGAIFNDTNYTITYKNAMYQVAEDGTLSKAEGLVLLDKLALINGVDASYQLTVEQKNINAPSLSWTSSDTSVATVSSSTGLVTVVGQGETKITVSGTYNNKNYSAECDVTVADLEVSLEENKEIVIGESEQVSLTITPASVATRTDITIDWTSTAISPNTWVATFDSLTGVSINVGVPQGTTADTTTKITATIKKGENTLTTKNCTITAKTSPWIDSSYVEYNVEYTDVYTETKYKADTGWRLITKIEDDTQHYNAQAGTYEGNIEIISTGVPAKLYYPYSVSITDFEIEDDLKNVTKGKWAGNLAQRTQFLTEYNYPNRRTSDRNIYTASGLLYNFGNIVFKVTGTKDTLESYFEEGVLYGQEGYGGYIEIKKNGNTTGIVASDTTTGDDLFKATIENGTIEKIRLGNLKDIKNINDSSDRTQITEQTDKRPGLFRLDQYTPVPQYVDSNLNCLLASPDDRNGTNYGFGLYSVNHFGGFYVYSGSFGVRPIISITNVKLKRNGNVWKIVSNF